MPIECKLLERQPFAFEACPKCGEKFPEFMRGMIQRGKRWFLIGPKRPHCAVICHGCKEIIGWESPPADPQSRATEAAELPDSPEAEAWRQALTRDLESALADLLPKCQPKGDVCDT